MSHPDPSSNGDEDIINSEMPIEEIISALAKRNCMDITSSIDLSACSEYPCAGGGFCDVYRGKQYDGTRIAIKSLRIYDGPEAEKQKRKILKHAAKELYLWSKLKHRNVLPLIGLTLYRGHISMVSEWMENGSLTSFLQLHPDANRMCICMDICAGLRYIHSHEMVHGDLKGANVVVSSEGVAMITDFGNAHLKDLTLRFSKTTSHGLSIRWAAPELLEDDTHAVSKETDVYAYGITALEAMSGEVPYNGLTDIQIFRLVAVKNGYPSRPDIDLISDDLWNVLVLCWTRNPTERPTIAAISRSLQALHPDCKSHPDTNNPRRFNGLPRSRNGLEEIYDEPAEERIRLLSDLDKLDHEVYEGLITGLKISSLASTSAPSLKEVLFPAKLIALISNEMWRYGMIKESERFLANTMQSIQAHVMSFIGEDAIVPGVFWLSNVHEILSFVCCAENDLIKGIGPIGDAPNFDWEAYEHLIQMVKSDLDSLEYNIYHSWMVETKKRLSKMIIPALIETQSLPGFITSEGAGRFFNRLLNQNTTPAFSMDDVLNLLNKVLKSLKCFFMEESVVQQVVTELLKMVGVTSFNDLLMRRNFCSWKRAMQIDNNATQIKEWCEAHEMPEGTLQLEHLMQATKLLQLKKTTQADIDIIYDVCWILTPSQIQRMCANYFVADYENPISPEILKLVAQRVQPNDRTDHLLLTPENEDVAPYELPLPREVSSLEHYVPAYLNVPHIRRLAAISP